MKAFITALVLSTLSVSVAQASNLVCAIKESANPKNYASLKVNLDQPVDDSFAGGKTIDIGEDNYSFDLGITYEGNTLELSAIFYENNHVQDEVASYSWTLDLSKVEARKPIVTEPLEENGKKVMDFVCYYNK